MVGECVVRWEEYVLLFGHIETVLAGDVLNNN